MVSILGAVAAGSLFVGVLEQPQCKDGHARSVRVLFERGPAGWRSLADGKSATEALPSRWTVAFDGRSLGEIATTDPGWKSEHAWTYPRDRLFQVVGEPPGVRAGDSHFGGWCEPPLLRPLIVVSQPNVADPARWKRVQQPQDLRDTVFAEFKRYAGPQSYCPVDVEKPIDFRYTVRHLVQLTCYADAAGRRLVAVSLDPNQNGCDWPSEPAWWANWFIVPPDGQGPVFLGNGLWVVDAGDYDRDGHSELIFWFSGYNRDGYVLFTGDSGQRLDYLWNYH
jgi:hypothetical protein